ncbi:hypothetical protein GCM10027440_05290 [Nocardiopsis coralliicola]
MLRMVAKRLEIAHRRFDSGLCPSLSEFDSVRGPSGLGAYLLHRSPQAPELRAVLDYLVRLTTPRPAPHAAEGALPGWWSRESSAGQRVNRVEDGHANLGMAHGIAGPLALLAHCARAGIAVDG